jgi:hypothetical protein
MKLLCKTTEMFENLTTTGNEKIVMKVSRRTSHFMLALSLMDPVYCSLSLDDGKEDCLKIFNDEFNAHEDTIDADEGEDNNELQDETAPEL